MLRCHVSPSSKHFFWVTHHGVLPWVFNGCINTLFFSCREICREPTHDSNMGTGKTISSSTLGTVISLQQPPTFTLKRFLLKQALFGYIIYLNRNQNSDKKSMGREPNTFESHLSRKTWRWCHNNNTLSCIHITINTNRAKNHFYPFLYYPQCIITWLTSTVGDNTITSPSFIQQSNYLIVKHFVFIKDEDLQNKTILCVSNL